MTEGTKLFLYIRISLEHLWRAVLQRATEVVKELLRRHRGCGAKVNESDVETFVDDDVLILYVSVKDALCSQVKNCSHKLSKDGSPHFNTNVFTPYGQYILFFFFFFCLFSQLCTGYMPV